MSTRLKFLYHLVLAMLFLVMLFLHKSADAGNGMANGTSTKSGQELNNLKIGIHTGSKGVML